jgi:hypothetical protein
VLNGSPESFKQLNYRQIQNPWNDKQKRAFQNITTGFKIANKQNEPVRFLTLSTSNIQFENIEYDDKKLNDNVRKLKQRIKRLTIATLVKDGYIKTKTIHYYYPGVPLTKNFRFEYFRIITSEGNGVVHILYKGEYIPYTWLVDNWQDLHNSWNIDIRLINKDFKRHSRYIVSQYLSNQQTAYIRSSQSWNWIIRAYRKEWLHYLDLCHNRYFYNPIKNRFYRKNKHYMEYQTSIDDEPPPQKGIEVNIFEQWYEHIYNRIKKEPVQTKFGC